MAWPSGYTLHQASGYLSLAGLVLFFGSIIGVIYSTATSRNKRRIELSKRMAADWIAMPVKSEIPVRLSLVARLRSRFSTIRTRTRGLARTWPIYFVGVFCLGMGYAVTRLPKYEIVTEHHIRIIKQVAPNEWAMSSDEQGMFLYTGCNDFPNAKVIWAGYIADHARWEERGECKSIRRQDLGFWWERDERYNAKEIGQ